MKKSLIALCLSITSLTTFALEPIPQQSLATLLRDRAVQTGCQIAAKVSVDWVKKIGTAACPIPEPTMTTKVACAVGLALNNKKVSALAVTGMTEACVWSVKKASDGVVTITVEARKAGHEAAKEMESLMNFLNTADGAIWFVNKIGH